jgi:phosphohistidine phosphatase SixA
MRRRWSTSVLVAIVSAATLVGAAGVASAGDEDGLWAALAEGGKVVMIRHAATEEATAEASMSLAEDGDCTREQNLTDAGRMQATALGQRFREHEVSVDSVLSSGYCRARETAALAFGDYEAWNALNLAEALPPGDAEFLMEDVRDRIGDFTGDGNLVLMTHRSNINTITFQQTEPADMVVLVPDRMGGFTTLGLIAAP